MSLGYFQNITFKLKTAVVTFSSTSEKIGYFFIPVSWNCHTARDNFLMEQGHVNAQQCDQIQRNFAILAKILSLTAISSWLFEILGEFPSL